MADAPERYDPDVRHRGSATVPKMVVAHNGDWVEWGEYEALALAHQSDSHRLAKLEAFVRSVRSYYDDTEMGVPALSGVARVNLQLAIEEVTP